MRKGIILAFFGCILLLTAAFAADKPAPAPPSGEQEVKSQEQIEWEASVAPKYKNLPALRYVQDNPHLPRVLLIGDSIMTGYTERVRKALEGKVNVHRIPVNGGNTQLGLDQLEKWLGNKPWDVIHFNWGIHDLSRTKDGKPDVSGPPMFPVEKYADNLDKLVSRLETTGAKLIWAATTPVPPGNNGKIAGDEVIYNAAAEKVMNKHGVPINDLHAFVLLHKGEAQGAKGPTDAHFNDAGSQLLAGKIADEILAALNSGKASTAKEKP